MDKERVSYLTTDEQRFIEHWMVHLEPLKEKYPSLDRVDLVIEGGVGTGITMPHIVRALFSKALYVGTDLSPTLAAGRRRWQGSSFKEEALQKVLKANESPGLYMDDGVIFGNCFNKDLIHDITKKTGCQYPFLVSYNALNSLLDRKMNMWERKDREDIYSLEETVSPENPYVGQLHIINDSSLWDEDDPTACTERNYHHLEDTAKISGWIIERINYGLLILKTDFMQ